MTDSLQKYKLNVLEEKKRRSRARNSLLDFVEYVWPGYMRAKHLEAIAEKLEAVERGDISRLMIFMPPRHGKTELSTINFTAWCMGRDPSRQIISSSYNQALATNFGRKVRNKIRTDEFLRIFPDATLSGDNKAADQWSLTAGGEYVSAGVGSSITGRGADIAIIDDPIKDRKSADSVTIRNAIWDWYTSTFYTRLMPGGRIVLIQTRWHEDDLAGRLLKCMESGDEFGDQWDILSLPAINEAGNPLWPDRYSLKALQRIRIAVGARDWAALYQQSPQTPGGNVFKQKWFQFIPRCDFPKGWDDVVQIWDTAFKEDQENDYCACVTMGLHENKFYILDVLNEKMEWPELLRTAQAQYAKHRPRLVLIEDKASGTSLIQALAYSTLIPVFPIQAVDSKYQRAVSSTGIFEAGRVYVPTEAIWVDEYIDQMIKFPAGANDDMVDGTVHGVRYFMLREGEEIIEEGPEFSGPSLGLHAVGY